MDNPKISHVSDTALWIAAIRAEETERADAAFKDTLAGKLAGERGREIMASLPHGEAMAFAMVIRTTAIDQLVKQAVSLGIDTVINLGAGLDTRPYRMVLPPELRWVEVDYPHLIRYKNDQLQSERPGCVLERIPADLSREDERKALFARLDAQAGNALILTEGVIGYLTSSEAAALSRDLFVVPSFKYWIQDYSQGRWRRTRHSRDLAKNFQNAPWQFNEPDPLGFFGRQGWTIRDQIFILDEARRIGRAFPSMFPWSLLLRLFPKVVHRMGNRTYGYVMFGKTG